MDFGGAGRAGLLWFAGCLVLAGNAPAATDVRVSFTLRTTDAAGAEVLQNRVYFVYRPDNLSKTTPVPMVVVTDGNGPAGFLHSKADRAAFLVVSCDYSGNSTGHVNNGNPRETGWEDYDYLAEVIRRVKASENANDAFTVGFSAGGHTSLAYACERPSTLKAAASVDEFMQVSNVPSAPLPVILFEGTADANVSYTMVKDTVDRWRAVDGLLEARPVTTYEASPRMPGQVSQATWRGEEGGTQVAFVTIIGGTHTYPTGDKQTGYDIADGLWAFFSQFLTPSQSSPKIVAQPVDNIQESGQPASFRVSATGAHLRIQWQKNGVDIPGASSNWFTTAPVALPDSGAVFRAVVSNDAGTVTSESATLTVKAVPAGPTVTAPPADLAVKAGQPATFRVSAKGHPPLRYQWKKNGLDIVGANGESLTMTAISPDCGAGITVVVSDGTGSTASPQATLTVTPTPGAPVIVENPARARVTVNQKASFSVSARSGSPMTYQWQKGAGIGNMVDIPGATQATYEIPSPTLADSKTRIRCVVSNAAGNVTSASEMLLVTPR